MAGAAQLQHDRASEPATAADGVLTSGPAVLTLALHHARSEWRLPEAALTRIRTAAAEAGIEDVRVPADHDELLRALPESTHLVGFPLAADRFAQTAQRVRFVQLTGALSSAASAAREALGRGVRIAAAERIRSVAVAEHATALTLALTRRLGSAVIAQAEHQWRSTEIAEEVRDLSGRTAAVLGTPPVVEAIASRLRAFGVRTLGCAVPAASVSGDADNALGCDEAVELAALENALVRASVVVVATPRVPQAVGLLGRDRLKALGPDGLIVDVGRGGAIESKALLELLRRRRLGAAALDAFDQRPLPPTSPLWTMPNVIITPSVAGASPGYWERASEVIASNVRASASGGALIDEVNERWFDPPSKRRR